MKASNCPVDIKAQGPGGGLDWTAISVLKSP